MKPTDPDFFDKLYRVVCGCQNQQQLTVAGRYLSLAIKSGYVHGLDFSILKQVGKDEPSAKKIHN